MSISTPDEGFNEDEAVVASPITFITPVRVDSSRFASNMASMQECEELAYQLLASLPRSRLAMIQRRLAPLLQFDLVGTLPTEISLQIFSQLPWETLLACCLVSQRWHTLANDHSLWKSLCSMNQWSWKSPPNPLSRINVNVHESLDNDNDDEGMGDSDAEDLESEDDTIMQDAQAYEADLSMLHAELDSGFISTDSFSGPSTSTVTPLKPSKSRTTPAHSKRTAGVLSVVPTETFKPDYKLLYLTHIKLRRRFRTASYQLSHLQTRGVTSNSHTNTIYCLQLYTYPTTGEQVLFTGSRDRTIREWSLATGEVKRVIADVHTSSVLSVCVHNGILASAGSDRRVAVWDLHLDKPITVLRDHEDSVLCVRIDDTRLVSCSKDRTVRTYLFPDLRPQFVLQAHRAAVNAVSISPSLIISGSGDRSVRLWDAKTGNLVKAFDNHHSRGIASIDFQAPYVLSGSSDRHLRLYDVTNMQGWSTSPEQNDTVANPPISQASQVLPQNPVVVCNSCGSPNPQSNGTDGSQETATIVPQPHEDLVRSVALGDEVVVSGSYDMTVKVWDRKTGAMLADLSGGHTGRIFCVHVDSTKVVSCGEDQRICIWDFSHGIDTTFLA